MTWTQFGGYAVVVGMICLAAYLTLRGINTRR